MLAPWLELPRVRPERGWLYTLRQVMGLTTRQMASRAGVTQGAVGTVEQAEAKGVITVASLQRYAAAMGCTLVYAILPIAGPVRQLRAEHKLEWKIRRGTTDPEEWRVDIERALLRGKSSRLWRD